MNINTTLVINSIKNDIQKKIDMEQKRLNDIHDSMRMAEEFLLDNGSHDITQDDDILQKVMITIKELREKISINDTDIKSIQQSLESLNSISNKIDKAILTSLTTKVEDIKDDINIITNKLNSTNEFLPILLNLHFVCPQCKGSSNGTSSGGENKRFNSTGSTICTYCEGIGVLSIGKILQNENLLEDETFNQHNRQERNEMIEDRKRLIDEVRNKNKEVDKQEENLASYNNFNIQRKK
ncbi:hypothetical protein [Alkaliphilus sp. B6464]|uniref:hypothetical protein n=1 Tax=Alkaliphilus sp. B6464 TaxID=2731219 RepID=UPI001BA4B62C|nr:hypothetical protein [Alkaliphilus sp. B6464]QUH21904.1 hypothetical protein HYG84_18380 [Alkaliphilus sp. B6464]